MRLPLYDDVSPAAPSREDSRLGLGITEESPLATIYEGWRDDDWRASGTVMPCEEGRWRCAQRSGRPFPESRLSDPPLGIRQFRVSDRSQTVTPLVSSRNDGGSGIDSSEERIWHAMRYGWFSP